MSGLMFTILAYQFLTLLIKIFIELICFCVTRKDEIINNKTIIFANIISSVATVHSHVKNKIIGVRNVYSAFQAISIGNFETTSSCLNWKFCQCMLPVVLTCEEMERKGKAASSWGRVVCTHDPSNTRIYANSIVSEPPSLFSSAVS